MMRRHSALLLAFALGGLLGAARVPGRCTQPPAPEQRKGASAWLEVENAAGERGQLSVVICVVTPDENVRLGSYRGEVRWDSTALDAAGVERPPGGMRLENLRTPGIVKFAGATPSGFMSGPQLVLHLRPTAARRAGGGLQKPQLQMQEMHGTDGRSLIPQVP